jgi:hypothetical protein
MDTQILDDEVVEFKARTFVDLALEVDQVYTILDALYFDRENPPLKVMELIKEIEYTLIDHDLPLDREEYTTQEAVIHPDNEQYKRVTYWLNAEHNDK